MGEHDGGITIEDRDAHDGIDDTIHHRGDDGGVVTTTTTTTMRGSGGGGSGSYLRVTKDHSGVTITTVIGGVAVRGGG